MREQGRSSVFTLKRLKFEPLSLSVEAFSLNAEAFSSNVEAL